MDLALSREVKRQGQRNRAILSANIYINTGCMQRTGTIMLKVFALVFLGRLYIAVLSLKNISGLYV